MNLSAKFTSVLGKSLHKETGPANKRVRPASSAKKPVNKASTPLHETGKSANQRVSGSTHKINQSIKTATQQAEIKSNEKQIVKFTEKNEPLKTSVQPDNAKKTIAKESAVAANEESKEIPKILDLGSFGGSKLQTVNPQI